MTLNSSNHPNLNHPNLNHPKVSVKEFLR